MSESTIDESKDGVRNVIQYVLEPDSASVRYKRLIEAFILILVVSAFVEVFEATEESRKELAEAKMDLWYWYERQWIRAEYILKLREQ